MSIVVYYIKPFKLFPPKKSQHRPLSEIHADYLVSYQFTVCFTIPKIVPPQYKYKSSNKKRTPVRFSLHPSRIQKSSTHHEEYPFKSFHQIVHARPLVDVPILKTPESLSYSHSCSVNNSSNHIPVTICGFHDTSSGESHPAARILVEFC